MEHTLLLGALGLGCIGWASALLLILAKREASAPVARPSFWWLALALPIVLWAATLPTAPPFSDGQGWGRGLLLGALVSLASAWIIARASANTAKIAATAPFFGALVAVCIPLIWMRPSVIDALMGVGVGWCLVAAIIALGLAGKSQLKILMLLNGAAFAATLSGAAGLGVYRDFIARTVALGTYPAIAVVVAASVAMALLAGALVGEITAGFNAQNPKLTPLWNGLNWLLSLILPIGIAIVLGTKLLDETALIGIVVTGSTLGLALWWLARDAAQSRLAMPIAGVSAAAIVVALCGFMLAYQVFQGFGVALMLLAAWPAATLSLSPLPLEDGEEAKFDGARMLSLSLSFLAILTLSRFFETRFGTDLRGAGLSDQFALFGFVAGLALPLGLAQLWFGARETVDRSPARVLGIGVLAMALLGAMLTLWGAKVCPAFFAGLGLAALGFSTGNASRIRTLATAFVALTVALTLCQWTHHFAPLSELGRAQRLIFVAWSVGALVVVAVALEVGARLARRKVQKGVAAPN